MYQPNNAPSFPPRTCKYSRRHGFTVGLQRLITKRLPTFIFSYVPMFSSQNITLLLILNYIYSIPLIFYVSFCSIPLTELRKMLRAWSFHLISDLGHLKLQNHSSMKIQKPKTPQKYLNFLILTTLNCLLFAKYNYNF